MCAPGVPAAFTPRRQLSWRTAIGTTHLKLGPRIQRWDLNLGTGRSARSAQREVSRHFNVMPRTYPRPDLCGLIHTRVTTVRPDQVIFAGSDARFVSAKAGKIHRVTFCTSRPTSYYRKPSLHHSAKWLGCVRVSVARRYFFLRSRWRAPADRPPLPTRAISSKAVRLSQIRAGRGDPCLRSGLILGGQKTHRWWGLWA